MRAIRNATNHELEGISPQLLSDEYELRIRDGELLAKLVMHGSNSADAVCVEGSFRFQRKGLFKTQTVVYAGDARTPMATLAPSSNDSTLTFGDDRFSRYIWRKAGVGGASEWVGSAGRSIVQFWPASVSSSARVRFQPGAEQARDIALLVLLGSFLASLAKKDVLIPALAITILNQDK
jgi:hypothetical protein